MGSIPKNSPTNFPAPITKYVTIAIVMIIDAKAAITLAVSPSRPFPNLKCIHSAWVMTCERLFHLPINTIKNAMIRVTPPLISIKKPFVPSAYINAVLIIVPAISVLDAIPDAPNTHHGSLRSPKK